MVCGLCDAHKLSGLFCVFREPRTADRACENGPRQIDEKTSQLYTAGCRVHVPIKRTQVDEFYVACVSVRVHSVSFRAILVLPPSDPRRNISTWYGRMRGT